MLLGQQGGGGKESHLLAAHGSHKGGAQGDLGLAKAYIAADQTVHGLGAEHVVNHGMDGRLLVSRFFKAKVLGELLVVLHIQTEGMAFTRSAAGVDVEQLGGCIAHLLGSLALGFFPLVAAQVVQGCRFGVTPV